MKLWVKDKAFNVRDNKYRKFIFGIFVDQHAHLVENTRKLVQCQFGKPDVRDIEAWFIPPGHSTNIELLETLSKDNVNVYVSVNGLSQFSIKKAMQKLGDNNCIWTIVDTDLDEVSFLEQLSWLSRQNQHAAVMSTDIKRLMTAYLISPFALIFDGNSNELADLARLIDIDSRRPMSAAEVDSLEGAEVSISVSREMVSGDVVAEEDLIPMVTETRGLSPAFIDNIIGCVVRYPIRTGEPITFGHLCSSKSNGL